MIQHDYIENWTPVKNTYKTAWVLIILVILGTWGCVALGKKVIDVQHAHTMRVLQIEHMQDNMTRMQQKINWNEYRIEVAQQNVHALLCHLYPDDEICTGGPDES